MNDTERRYYERGVRVTQFGIGAGSWIALNLLVGGNGFGLALLAQIGDKILLR